MGWVFNLTVAHGEDATKLSNHSDPVVLVYDCPPLSASHSDRKGFISKLQMALGNGTPVLVQGWNPQLPCQNDTFEDTVLAHFGEHRSIVSWQCKLICQP